MLKKRIIFTLLYDSGNFMLSRNFRLQRVGDIHWLKQNYNFSKISFFIDELIILDVTRGVKNSDNFCKALKSLTEGCFVPISAGGGIRDIENARILLRSGADKIVINHTLFNQVELVKELIQEFGQQCIIGSLDVKKNINCDYTVYTDFGLNAIEDSLKNILNKLGENNFGELYLNSIDKDGTGQGFDLDILESLPNSYQIPVIMAGGAGNSSHLHEALSDIRVDAVATANLFNFIGDGLRLARRDLRDLTIDLAGWPNIEDIKITE